MIDRPHHCSLCPYTTLFRSNRLTARSSSYVTRRSPRTTPRFLRRSTSTTRPPASSYRTASRPTSTARSEEHTSELQSPCNLVCRLLLEKKTQPTHTWRQARK